METGKRRINPKTFAFECSEAILRKAKESGEETKPYVRNALRFISLYYYNSRLVRQMYDRVMLRLARKRVENLVNGSLFNDPKPGLINGNILIANTASNIPVGLTTRHVNENIGIWGRLGSGKTNLSQIIVLCLMRLGIPVRAYDYKGEYRDLLPYIHDMLVLNRENDEFNPLKPLNDPRNWIPFFTDILQQDFNIKTETKIMLISYMDDLYKRFGVYENSGKYPSMHDLRDYLAEQADKKSTSVSKRRKIYTLLEVFDSIISSLGEMLDCSEGYTEEKLSGFSFVAYEMNDLSSNIQSWLSKLRLKHLHHECFKTRQRNKLKMVAIIEEAKMLFSENLHRKSTSIDYLKQLITQGRSLGFGAVITDQNKNDLAEFVVNNISCQVCFNLASPKEIRSTGYSMRCNEEQIKQIPFLDIPYAVLGIAGHDPFMIKIPKSPVEKHFTNKDIKRFLRSRLGNKAYYPEHEEKHETKPEPDKRSSLKGLLQDYRQFLLHINKEPETNITQLYASLKLSGRKGNRIKRQLLANLLIQEKTIHTGQKKRPVKKLELTKKGTKVLSWLENKAKAV